MNLNINFECFNIIRELNMKISKLTKTHYPRAGGKTHTCKCGNKRNFVLNKSQFYNRRDYVECTKCGYTDWTAGKRSCWMYWKALGRTIIVKGIREIHTIHNKAIETIIENDIMSSDTFASSKESFVFKNIALHYLDFTHQKHVLKPCVLTQYDMVLFPMLHNYPLHRDEIIKDYCKYVIDRQKFNFYMWDDFCSSMFVPTLVM